MDFLGADDLARLPVDQLTSYVLTVTDHAKQITTKHHAADAQNRELAARCTKLESELLDRDLTTLAEKANAYSVETMLPQIKARNPRRDDSGRIVVDSDVGPQPVETVVAGWRDDPARRFLFRDLYEAGPLPPTKADGTIDRRELAKDTAAYIAMRQKNPAAIGVRPTKFGTSR